jgi:hypothetical protein
MPIRINLKEIFSSDPQEILVDKLNFNYNKLLELGVGTPGPTGLTGPQGPAGPIGLVGPQGDRGATWWVDSGDPNTLTFTGLIDGDLYLDQTSNVFQVWKYDDGTSTWVTVVSIAAIVTSYLSSLSNIPFETVTTFQAPGSTAVNKFILFDKRDDYVADATRGTANVSLNNMLFLNNFDETDVTYPTLGQDQYNSLLSIFPAHDDTQDSGRAQSGRYHIEMGSLYMDSDVLPVGTIKYSDLKHNLKAKFYKQYVDPILPPQLPATNTWINTARFSLSYTESQSLLDIDQNAAFEFLFPKWNNENPSIGGVTSWTADGLGTGYTTATGVATTSAGGGTGLTVNITAVLGAITAVIVNNLGSGYEVGDIVTINGGSTSESLTITSVIQPTREELSVVFSSAEAVVERSPAHTHIVADGIHISTTSSSINSTIGLALDYSSLNAKLDAKNHLMLDSNSGVDGVILLNKSTFVNGDANIVDGLAIGSGYEDLTAPANSLIVEDRIGVGISAPSSSVRQHNYLTGTLNSRTVTYNDIQDLTVVGTTIPGPPPFFIPILLPGSIIGTRTDLENITGSPITYLSRSSISGTNSVGAFLGSSISFTGTTNITGNFTGVEIDLSSATSVAHNGSFYGTKIALDNFSDFSGANRQVFGNYFQLAPDLSAVTGSAALRGSLVELSGYVPNSVTEIRGSDLLIQQTNGALNQGAIFGNNIRLSVNSVGSAASSVTGLNITMNTSSFYTLPNLSYGINIVNSGTLTSSGTTYGLKYNYTDSTIVSGGKAYGYYIEGNTDNYTEGDSRFKGSVSINTDSTKTFNPGLGNTLLPQYVKNVWHGWFAIGFNNAMPTSMFAISQQVPDGFDWTETDTTNNRVPSTSTAFMRLLHPTLSSKAVIQVTPRYGGSDGNTATLITVSPGTTFTTIYFRDLASTWTNDTKIGFFFSVFDPI